MEPDPAARVCPRCGEKAGEQRFCGGCGLNLSEQLPSPEEWETDRASQSRVEQDESADPWVRRGFQLARLWTKVRSDAKRWYGRRSRSGKTAVIALAAVLVVIVISLATQAGGSGGVGGSVSEARPARQPTDEKSAPSAQPTDYRAGAKEEFLHGCEVQPGMSASCHCILRHVEAAETETQYWSTVIRERGAPASQEPPHAKEFVEDCRNE